MLSDFVYRHRFVPVAFGVFLLVGADGKGCSCKKSNVDDMVDDGAAIRVTPPSVELQVVSVNPARIEADRTASVTVLGSGFESGASVLVGTATATGVRVLDAGRISMTVPALSAGRYDVVVNQPNGETATLRNGLTAEVAVASCTNTTVYFDTARDELTTAARATIDADIACYTSRTDGMRLEGHADERGTTDYNLALGQRRAESVKRYISGQGVSPGRIETLSYGEERPADRGHGEAAWAKNRRVEVYVAQ